MKVLITSGGTEEPIDGVRSITNFSTGKTGAIIADYFSNNGADVILLKGKRAVLPMNSLTIIEFSSFMDLDTKMKKLLSSEFFDSVIHLAAVSDFSLDYIESNGHRLEDPSGKLDSSKPLTIHLKPNFKILDHIKEYSKNNLINIGFKLTKNESNSNIKQKISKMFLKKTIDFVVHNDLDNITERIHPANIYYNNELIEKTKTKQKLAEALFNLIKEKLDGIMS